ncbi:MAG: sterol desaturase family protein [Bacteroidia bacterium]|nr:sterol desaturase family protein [Bacteroidia bacterium]
MDKYKTIFFDSFSNYWNYLIAEISNPGWHNYFYWLIGLSLLAWALEAIAPWRKNQSIIRRDFWLDAFYMFFNFFLFSLVGYNAISNIGVEAFNDFLAIFGIKNLVAIQIGTWPKWTQLLLMFILADFIQWNVHRLLHRVPFLWQFHKVHHSVKQMGFAAHLRFHWMETIVYKSIQYIPLAMIGFGIKDFFIIHIIAIGIGHLNHANVGWDYGPLKYVLNNPKMHIWHHAKELPSGSYGVNFGLSLSIWDYLFKTDYIPNDGRDIELGFAKDEEFPQDFVHQISYPFSHLKED